MFKSYVVGTENFPKPGVVYWDFTPLLANPEKRDRAVHAFCEHFKNGGYTHIAAIEAKGFILGSLLAHEMHLPLVLVRKPGLTPGEVVSQTFVKEYGTSTYEMAKERLPPNSRVLLVYDILAGPGATLAAVNLIQDFGAKVLGCAYVIELIYLSGREQLPGLDVFSLVNIHEEERDGIRSHKF